MVISDHVNLMGDNPLRGPNDERFGPRFPDMSGVYSPALQELVVEEAKAIGAEVRRGIYGGLVWSKLRNAGRDSSVAEPRRRRGRRMSTVPEAIVARHMDMEVLGSRVSQTWPRASATSRSITPK